MEVFALTEFSLVSCDSSVRGIFLNSCCRSNMALENIDYCVLVSFVSGALKSEEFHRITKWK